MDPLNRKTFDMLKAIADIDGSEDIKAELETLRNNPVAQARLERQLNLHRKPKDKKWHQLRGILLEAVKTGNQQAVSSAIRHGADVIFYLMIPFENDVACTFLGLAAIHGHSNLINCLVKAGVDIDDPGTTNRSPLQLAVESNDVEFARKLIEEGADMEVTSNEAAAFTALHLAVSKGHSECMKLLVEAKANIEAITDLKETPLLSAAHHNQLYAIEILLEAGCNKDARTHTGGTALHVAAMYNNKEAVELLIKKGFDPELKDTFGHTPMVNAEMRGHETLANWLAKSRFGNLEDFNMDRLLNEGTVASSDQTAISNYSIRYYEGDNDNIFDMVNSSSQLTLKWKQLKVNIPSEHSGYYQNEKGLTVLHVASVNGHFEAVQLLIKELKIYPYLKDYNGDVPADLADIAGHHRIAKYLRNSFKQKTLSISDQNRLYEQLLAVISCSDNVQEASQLLIQGAPLESYGRTSPSALAMAILWNRVMIMELLLAAGPPLTVKHHGKTLLQVAWFSPDVTVRVKTIITRAFFSILMWERVRYVFEIETEELDSFLTREKVKFFSKNYRPEHHKYLWMANSKKVTKSKTFLNVGLEDLLDALNGEAPWKAKWSIIKDESFAKLESATQLRIPNNPLGFSVLMWTAAKYNCKLTTFFLHEAGGRPNHRVWLGLTPLHETLDAKFYDLATIMVKHLGASLYIPDRNGRFPKDLMPTDMSQQLEKEQVIEEFNKLENSIMSARSDAEKEETKEIALVLVCLYATFTRRWDHYVCKWQLLHHYIVSIIQVKSKLQKHTFKSDPDKVSQNGDFIWVSLICQDLNQLNKGNHIPNDDTATGFLELLSCIEDLSNIIRINESKLNIIQSNKTCKYSNIYTNNVLLKSVKLATEKNYRTFLHLLFTIGEQSLDVQLNNLIRSLPLHHAAATGNFCAILYLSVTAKAYGNVLDRNNNTPAHLAYMNGYRYIGDYICKNVQNVKSMKNNAGQTPTNIREAFQEYEKLYNIVKEEEETDESVNLTEQIDGMSLTTRLLDHWLSKSKSMSFRKIMDNSIVNYSFGEAKLVQSLVIDFAKSIGNKIAEYNPLLKGTLVLVGSAGDNVRLNAPDESDCTWLLDWKNVRVILEDMSEEDQKFKHYKHSIRAESDDMEINRLLEGTNLLEEFYNQTLKAVSELLPNLDPRISLILPRVKRIGCGVCITLAWAGTTYPMLMVDMDLVPAIKASRPANFTHPPLTKNIVDPRLDAIVVVQTHIKSGEIRCSTTLEEQVVMQRLSTGQHLVFIIAKLLVSKLKTEKWASKLFRERFTFFSTKQFKLPAPTGFLLKSSFFQELENVPNPDDWEENCIVDRLKGIFFSMCKKDDKDKLHSGLIPSYFSSTIQPPAAGFMAPAICKFILDNEKELRKMEDSTSDRNEAEELQQLAVMWNMALNKYYNID